MIELDPESRYHIDLDYSALPNTSSSALSIQKYEKDEDLSYDAFFSNNLKKNEPCLFGSWLTEDWLSTKEWVSNNKTPNLQLFSSLFGKSKVPVADCDKKHFDAHEKETLLLEDYLNYYEHYQHGQNQQCLYLKDWHFVRDYPCYNAYDIPPYFASDWLNEFWADRTDAQDDYRFVYIGPKGSWTPLHADVFRSFSWSANICGRKRWVFYPPAEGPFLKNKFGELPYDVEAAELRNSSQYPKAHLAKGRLELIQERGETIFVPSNWYHQVWNLEDTISINHNWINGTNIGAVLDFFIHSLREVEKAIEDCREMDGWVAQCQLILKSTHGMDLREFVQFLEAISIRRIKYLKGDSTISSFPEWQLGKNHVVYDVMKLISSFERLLDEISTEVFYSLENDCNPDRVLDQLQSIV